MKYYIHHYQDGEITAYAEEGRNCLYLHSGTDGEEWSTNRHPSISANWESCSKEEWAAACEDILRRYRGPFENIIRADIEDFME